MLVNITTDFGVIEKVPDAFLVNIWLLFWSEMGNFTGPFPRFTRNYGQLFWKFGSISKRTTLAEPTFIKAGNFCR